MTNEKPSTALPFIIARLTDDSQFHFETTTGRAVIKDWVVIIAKNDLTTYDCRWMCNPVLGNYCLVPDIDITESEHIFGTFEEAREFIKEWWKNN